MAQWFICPNWIARYYRERDEVGRLFRTHFNITQIRVTNPTDREGMLGMVFWEERGDYNFHRSEWISGPWSAPPKWQRHIRTDPSLMWGDRYALGGWFEVWMSLDEMVIDVDILSITKNMIGGGASQGAGGVVASRAVRAVPLVRRRAPLGRIIPEFFLRNPGIPRHFYSANGQINRDRPILEPFDPNPPSSDPDE